MAESQSSSKSDTESLKLSEIVVSEDKRAVKIKVRSADEISLDQADPLHTVHIGKWKCQISSQNSTLSYVAVKSTQRPDLPPHLGVMVRNTFSVSGPEMEGLSGEEFPYLLGCAEFFKKKVSVNQPDSDSASDDGQSQKTDSSSASEEVFLATMFLFTFCKDREAVFDDIRRLHTTYAGAAEIQSEEVNSNMSLPDLVKTVVTELRKPFDKNWSRHHRSAEAGALKTKESETNCAICAYRMFFTLAVEEDKVKTWKGLETVSSKLGLKGAMAGYKEDFFPNSASNL